MQIYECDLNDMYVYTNTHTHLEGTVAGVLVSVATETNSPYSQQPTRISHYVTGL